MSARPSPSTSLASRRYRFEATITERVYIVRSVRPPHHSSTFTSLSLQVKTERLYACKLEWLAKEKSTKQMLVSARTGDLQSRQPAARFSAKCTC